MPYTVLLIPLTNHSVHLLRPLEPIGGRHGPWSAVVLDVVGRAGPAFWHLGLFQDEVATLHDDIELVDVDRASLDAGVAGVTGVEFLFRDVMIAEEVVLGGFFGSRNVLVAGNDDSSSLGCSLYFLISSKRSVSMTILRGESFLPVLAGHTSVQRPHSVQAYELTVDL